MNFLISCAVVLLGALGAWAGYEAQDSWRSILADRLRHRYRTLEVRVLVWTMIATVIAVACLGGALSLVTS